jgi:hypothetical protein
VPAHQLPRALDGVPDVEQLPHQRLDPAESPALVTGEPAGQRAFPQLGFQPRKLLRVSRSRDTGPLDFSASVPPSRQARRHRRTDPSVTRRSRATWLAVSPRANRSAARSRSRSRRCCSAGVYPPRCAYRMPRSYARSQPTSRADLYEFILVSSPSMHAMSPTQNGPICVPPLLRTAQLQGDPIRHGIEPR